jgi:hypothetical protein
VVDGGQDQLLELIASMVPSLLIAPIRMVNLQLHGCYGGKSSQSVWGLPLAKQRNIYEVVSETGMWWMEGRTMCWSSIVIASRVSPLGY